MTAFLFLLNPVALIFVILTGTAFVLVSVPATIKAVPVHRLLLIAETTLFGGSISITETGAGVEAGRASSWGARSAGRELGETTLFWEGVAAGAS